VPVRLHFSVWGDEQINRTLDRFVEAAEDMRPVWEVLRDRFLRLEGKQFRTEGGYASGGWPPLSPRYAAWKSRNFPGKTILRRTDELFLSLTTGPAVFVAEPRLLIMGSDVEYGGYHQRGAGVLPQRRPVELTEWERREWVRIMQRWIVTGRL
jgi:phage gpG-like protein